MLISTIKTVFLHKGPEEWLAFPGLSTVWEGSDLNTSSSDIHTMKHDAEINIIPTKDSFCVNDEKYGQQMNEW